MRLGYCKFLLGIFVFFVTYLFLNLEIRAEEARSKQLLVGESPLSAEELRVFRDLIQAFSPMTQYKVENHFDRKLYEAGEKLFASTALSGNKSMSCLSCHASAVAAENFPLSMGVGSEGSAGQPIAGDRPLGRNTQALMNLRHPNITSFFWDEKVKVIGNIPRNRLDASFRPGTYLTKFALLKSPFEVLNGSLEFSSNPEVLRIKKVFRHGLDVASITPMLSREEMLGEEIFPYFRDTHTTDASLQIWRFLVNQVKSDERFITQLLVQGFPELQSAAELNIAHIGVALGIFIGAKFQMANTPFDRTLKGGPNSKFAMSPDEKRGFMIFAGDRGSCTTCHAARDFEKLSPHFTSQMTTSVAAPDIGEIKFVSPGTDLVRYTPDVGRDFEKAFSFKVPSLRGVAFSAPYFHNGAFATLEEVVEHYNDIKKSLINYKFKEAQKWERLYGKNVVPISFLNISGVDSLSNNFFDPARPSILEAIFFNARANGPLTGSRRPIASDGSMPQNLGLSYVEKRNLVKFLRRSLSGF